MRSIMEDKRYTRTAAGDFGRSLVNFVKNAPRKEEALGLFQTQLRQVAARQAEKRQYFEDIISLSWEAGL